MSIVLGLDPGTRHFGWGVVGKNGTRLQHIAHGVCDVDKVGELGDRLVEIEAQLVDVIARYKPLQASIETLFFAKDASAAAKLGHARGVALLVCTRAGLESFEYAPARVKLAVTGAGRADKHQVAQMVRVVLGLPEAPRSDAADALAIAVTHLQGSPMLGRNGPARGFSGSANARESANPSLQAILRAARPSNR